MMHEVVNAHRKTCAINTHRKKRAPFDKRYQLVKRRYSVQACFPRRIPHSFLLDRVIGAALRRSVSSLALLALLEVEAASSALLVVTAETPEPAAGATTETTLRTGGTTETTEAAAGAAAIIEGAAPHVRVRSAVRVRPSLISRCLVLPSFHRKQLLLLLDLRRADLALLLLERKDGLPRLLFILFGAELGLGRAEAGLLFFVEGALLLLLLLLQLPELLHELLLVLGHLLALRLVAAAVAAPGALLREAPGRRILAPEAPAEAASEGAATHAAVSALLRREVETRGSRRQCQCSEEGEHCKLRKNESASAFTRCPAPLSP